MPDAHFVLPRMDSPFRDLTTNEIAYLGTIKSDLPISAVFTKKIFSAHILRQKLSARISFMCLFSVDASTHAVVVQYSHV